jgi:cell division protein FtsW
MKRTWSGNPFNLPTRIFLLTLVLCVIGLVSVYSASASYASIKRRNDVARRHGPDALAQDHLYHNPRYLERQAFWIVLGLGAMFLMYRVDYRHLKYKGHYLLGFSLFLLLLVFVPVIGHPINKHSRWIGIGAFTFQPSELAKLALIIYMARMLTDHHDRLKSLIHGFFPALLITAAFAFLILIEPDIGATAVMLAIVFFMWFIGGTRILHLGGLVLTAIPTLATAVMLFPNRLERLTAYFRVLWSILFSKDPTTEIAMGKGFQLLQSLVAVGSGGVTGLGLGNSMQKYFLSEQFSDFIFAIICEELGFVGALLIILCFFLLIWQGWLVALRAPDFFSTLLASGITLMLAISVGLNLMVVTGLAPTKGLALPLVSYGGSSLLITMASMGILMNIGKYVEEQQEAKRAVRRTSSAEPAPSRRSNKPRRSWFRRPQYGTVFRAS